MRTGVQLSIGTMARGFILGLIATALIVPVSMAQMRGGGFRGPGRSGYGFGRSYRGHHQNSFGNSLAGDYFLGNTPFLFDDYPFGYDGYPVAPAAPEGATPQVVVIQPPPAVDAPIPKTPPLLIELQGGRYVRYGGAAQSAEREAPAPASTAAEAGGKSASNSEEYDLPPTVLVYRDGHREEVADYAIVGRVMYAHRTSDGQGEYGLNNIQLSALDIPATMRANRQNGVSFVLPSGPNQVVTRP